MKRLLIVEVVPNTSASIIDMYFVLNCVCYVDSYYVMDAALQDNKAQTYLHATPPTTGRGGANDNWGQVRCNTKSIIGNRTYLFTTSTESVNQRRFICYVLYIMDSTVSGQVIAGFTGSENVNARLYSEDGGVLIEEFSFNNGG